MTPMLISAIWTIIQRFAMDALTGPELAQERILPSQPEGRRRWNLRAGQDEHDRTTGNKKPFSLFYIFRISGNLDAERARIAGGKPGHTGRGLSSSATQTPGHDPVPARSAGYASGPAVPPAGLGTGTAARERRYRQMSHYLGRRKGKAEPATAAAVTNPAQKP